MIRVSQEDVSAVMDALRKVEFRDINGLRTFLGKDEAELQRAAHLALTSLAPVWNFVLPENVWTSGTPNKDALVPFVEYRAPKGEAA